MKLTLFSRTILGYLIFIILICVVSLYSIVQLSEVNRVTRSIILFDNNQLGFYEKLTDNLFLETRNEKKFLLMQDSAFYDSYRQAKEDFNLTLFDAVQLTEDPDAKKILYNINRMHHYFSILILEETRHLKNAKQYAKSWYETEKENTANGILEDLKKVKLVTEKSVIQKVIDLSETGIKSSKIAIIITSVSLVFGLVFSYVATRSITNPLSAIKNKTKEIADGDLEGNLEISSPPEIAELAESLNFMRHKLKEVDNLKTDFFSLMSHELRTPLTSIKEGTNMLLEGLGGEVNDRQERLLAIIAEESNRLIRLVNSLLDLTKMQAGMMEYHFAETDLIKLVDRVMIEILPLAESKNVTIEKKLSEVPVVSIDEERILQVLRNLIGNAVKFSPEDGKILITVGLVDDQVQVAVNDNGPGVPMEHAERIFDKFKQVIPDGSQNFKGTGLGLATVKHIILAHGGKVWVESELNTGSTFYFVLPA